MREVFLTFAAPPPDVRTVSDRPAMLTESKGLRPKQDAQDFCSGLTRSEANPANPVLIFFVFASCALVENISFS